MSFKFLSILKVLFLVTLISCSSNEKSLTRSVSSKNGELKFDMSLIHILSSKPTAEDIHPEKLPYYVSYKNKDKVLIYLSTSHTSDIESKTHKAIDHILRSFEPKKVIVEVPPFQDKLSKNILKRCDLEKRCVEGLYAYKQSLKLGIEVVGGEPRHSEVLRNSLKHGLSKDEVLFFYTYRGVASWRQGDPNRAYNPEGPIVEIKSYIQNNKRRLALTDSSFDYADFVTIYESKMNRTFNYKNTRYNDIAPYKDGHYIQQLSVVIDKTREESILKQAERSMNEKSKVFIIYGSGHFLKHRPVLKNAFSSESIFSL